MIERNVAMAILGALPDDKILKALQVAGVAPAAMGGGMDGLAMGGEPGAMGNEGNKITPWSEREVTYAGGADRPSLIDRMWAKPGLMNAQQPVQGGSLEDDGSGAYLQTGGM